MQRRRDNIGGVIVYAVFEVGGQQFRAGLGEKVRVEALPQQIGDQVVLENVLLVSDAGQIQVGKPTVGGAQVKATVVEQSKGDKIVVFHYRPAASVTRSGRGIARITPGCAWTRL